MFPIHVLYIAPKRYEVCSDDGRLSREFPTRKEADIYAGALNAGRSDLDALAEVEKHRANRKRLNEMAANRTRLRKDLGLKRNRDGSWE